MPKLLLASTEPDCLPVPQPFVTPVSGKLEAHKCKLATLCLSPSTDPNAKSKALPDKNHHLRFKSFSSSNRVYSVLTAEGTEFYITARRSGLYYRKCSNSSSSHCLVSDVSPMQDFPPSLGGGLLHSRLLVFFP